MAFCPAYLLILSTLFYLVGRNTVGKYLIVLIKTIVILSLTSMVNETTMLNFFQDVK